jgi:hypothetical protein
MKSVSFIQYILCFDKIPNLQAVINQTKHTAIGNLFTTLFPTFPADF